MSSSKKSQSSRKGRNNKSSAYANRMPVGRVPRSLAYSGMKASDSIYPYVELDVPITPFTVNITSGAIAQSTDIGTGLIPNFSSRFSNLFNEYAIVGFRLEQRVVSATNASGFTVTAIDEENSANPTASILQLPHVEVPLVLGTDAMGTLHEIAWIARDYIDLSWTPTGTAHTVAYVKNFASSLNTFAAGSSSGFMSGSLALCFRGFA